MQFRRAIIGLLLLAANVSVVRAQQPHPVPVNRAQLKGGDWFPYVFSKIAPLEWWSFAASPAEVKREHYPSEGWFKLAQQDTWDFPRFCFSFFRPAPEAVIPLYQVIGEYQGAVFWEMADGCISAFAVKPTFYAPLANADGSPLDPKKFQQMLERPAKNPPHADPAFVRKAMEDLPKFCAWLEKRFDLTEKTPQQFDPQWLTREGLASSRGPMKNLLSLAPGLWSSARIPMKSPPGTENTVLKPGR